MSAIIGPMIAAVAPMILEKLFGGSRGARGAQGAQEPQRGGLGSMFGGTPGRIEALPTMAPEQQALLGQLAGGLGGQGGPLAGGLQNLQQMLSGGAGAFEAPAMRQFQEQIVPGIAERFTGMGAGAQQSSAFGQQLGQAGAGLAEQLAMQRSGMQERGMGQLMSLLGLGMGTSPFQYQQIPGQQGALSGLLGGLGRGLGQMGATLGTQWLGKKWGLTG